MSVANVAAVDAALVAALSADATLSTLLPDGVYLDIAPAGKTRFVLISFVTHDDVEGFGATLYELFTFQIKAVVLATTGIDADTAAYRIHQLLQRATLAPIDGYTHSSTTRVERIRYPDVDAIDSDIRWQHSGGHYEIFVSPN